MKPGVHYCCLRCCLDCYLHCSLRQRPETRVTVQFLLESISLLDQPWLAGLRLVLCMDSPKLAATAPVSEKMPLDELAVDRVVEGDKLKIFVDLYFWFSAHLIELYISIAESLGLRETPLSDYWKRVRWTCVSNSRTLCCRSNHD